MVFRWLTSKNPDSSSTENPLTSFQYAMDDDVEKLLPHLQAVINKHRPDLTAFIDIYKDIHQHAELSRFESRTGSVIARCLKDMGLEVHSSIGGHGVVGILRNGSGKTILLRAETDALPIEERTGLPYASKVRMKDLLGKEQPVMHACGHGIHIACVLASVKLLQSTSDEWSGTILAVFQPNEEGLEGAQAMIDDGLYPLCPQPDIMLAQHVGMSKAGLVAVRTGPVLAAADCLHIDITSDGPGPDNLNPPECPEPVSVACYLVARFQRIMSTEIDPAERATLVCLDFHAGEEGGVFTNSVRIRLEAETNGPKVRDRIFASAKAITEAECAVFGGKMKPSFKLTSRAPITRNDDRLATTLQQYFKSHFKERFWVPPMDVPIEDFSILSGPKSVPYVYWKLGSTDPRKWDEAERKGGNILEHLPTNHSPGFAPAPELTISTGTDAMSLASPAFS